MSFMWVSFVMWRISDGGSPLLAKANGPYWSSHVASWYRGNQDARNPVAGATINHDV
ncbi:hypothetical protein RQ479_29960 [Mesorhizobium sp. ISC25]|uniref:hypothetical protein n=1 Tax=Mesorhizobium sp. ISC25 TaxID=3077335 RepID=UPI0035DA19C9